MNTVEVEIGEVGARGDGVAMVDGRRVYVPLTLPGERVRIGLPAAGPGTDPLRAVAEEILAPAPDRVAPPCPHFGACGGCALQHMAGDSYADWKRAQVVRALARHGLGAAPVAAVVRVPPGDRRRATLLAERRPGGVALGFHARASRRVVDVGDVCPVLDPTLCRLLPGVREMLAGVLAAARRIGVGLALTESGPDLLLVCREEPSRADRERLADFASEAGLARIAWRGTEDDAAEPIVQARPVLQSWGGVPVALPPGAFLQASPTAEAALTGFVLESVGEAGAVADLYAGCGTFSLPLAARARVRAVEVDRAATEALRAAANAHGLAGRLEVERRDLARRPLLADELARFDAVVFDPPRAGARPQTAALAASKVPVVVAVSCNPATFARDARLLADGGYRLERVLPVDQFLWSPQVELAALFRR